MLRKILVFVFMFALLVASAQAATIMVAEDGSGDYTDLDSAITAAVAGDTIMVMPGTYNAPKVIIMKELTLIGSGTDQTFIKCNGYANRYGLAIYKVSNVSISNFCFINDVENGASNMPIGVGARQCSDIAVTQCKFVGYKDSEFSTPEAEPGRYLEHLPSPYLTSYGVYLDRSSNCKVTHNVIEDYDTGVALQAYNGVACKNNLVAFNTSSSSFGDGFESGISFLGAGIGVWDTMGDITKNKIIRNKATHSYTYGVLLYQLAGSSYNFSDNIVAANDLIDSDPPIGTNVEGLMENNTISQNPQQITSDHTPFIEPLIFE